MTERNSEDRRAADPRTSAARRSGSTAAPAPESPAPASREETLRLVHELQVHQIELEAQNEELHRTQEELDASRARYFDLYDQAPVGYVTVGEQGAILEANLTAATLLGVARVGLARRSFPGFVHPDDRDAYHLQRARLGEAGARHSWDMRMTRADGSPWWAHVQAALTRGGECRIALSDIGERKRAEAALAVADARLWQLQKAESLERMAGAIAHHFNNKLHAVTGNLELAMREPATSSGLLREAMQAALQAAEMSGLMLTYLGQRPDNRATLDLSQACRWTLPLLRASLPSGVALETDLPSPGPSVKAHADEVQQVLVNLLANAGEAVGVGGGGARLAVTTVSAAAVPHAHRFPVDWEPKEASYACLEVGDTGRGIAEEDLDRIFDPFFSDKGVGHGLGLAVVFGIVRAHGGAVSVLSEPGRGSTFRVFLPLQTGTARPAVTGPPEFDAGGGVLLVEDQELVRKTSAALLRGLGFSVLEACGGAEAVRALEGHREGIRLVLCDLTMPGMDGWETLAALRTVVPGLPVILTSGNDRAHALEGSHPQRPQAFLRKPYLLRDLRNAIRLALAGEATTG